MSSRWTIVCVISAMIWAVGCDEPADEPSSEPTPTIERAEPAADEEARPSEPQVRTAPGEQLMPNPIRGTVQETMNSGGYTYMRIEEGAVNVWVAAMQFEVEVGDRVVVHGGSLMQGFRSRTLNRTFDAIVFAGRAELESEEGAAPAAPSAPALPPGHPPLADG